MGNGREGGLRRVNKAAGAFLLCAAFETRTGRRPLAADLPELLDGIADAERDNGVKPGWLPPSVVEEHVGRELGAGSGHSASPAVAAIVGGVLGQEARSIHWSPYDRVRVVNADP
jgi:ubiquitin-like 1-activating enzyme E1 A